MKKEYEQEQEFQEKQIEKLTAQLQNESRQKQIFKNKVEENEKSIRMLEEKVQKKEE